MANGIRKEAQAYERRAAQHVQNGNHERAEISREGASVLHADADKHDAWLSRNR